MNRAKITIIKEEDVTEHFPRVKGIRARINPDNSLIDNVLNNFLYNTSEAQQEEYKERFTKYLADRPDVLEKIKTQEASIMNDTEKRKRLDVLLKNNKKLLIIYCANKILKAKAEEYNLEAKRNYSNKEILRETIHQSIKTNLPKIKGYNTEGKITFSAITTQQNVNKIFEELEKEGIFFCNSNQAYNINEQKLVENYLINLEKLNQIYEQIIIPFYNESFSERIFNFIKKLPTRRRNETYSLDYIPADVEKTALFFDYMPKLVNLL